MISAAGSYSHSYDSSLVERLLFRVARRWIAGYDQQSALDSAKEANGKGMGAILNYLGEDATDAANVGCTVREYLALMGEISHRQMAGCISVKPSQVGLSISRDLCLKNYRSIAVRAKELGQFLWIDMESAGSAEDAIEIYLELLKQYQMIGIAIQAYLRRSGSDIIHIIENGGKVRLVKGAYHEPQETAFVTREDVDSNYSRLLEELFQGKSDFAVATHDSKLVGQTMSLSKENPEARFEFQMLMGIRDELKSELVASGYRLSEYIPYGDQWLPYSVRRLRERKRNILLLARSLVP